MQPSAQNSQIMTHPSFSVPLQPYNPVGRFLSQQSCILLYLLHNPQSPQCHTINPEPQAIRVRQTSLILRGLSPCPLSATVGVFFIPSSLKPALRLRNNWLPQQRHTELPIERPTCPPEPTRSPASFFTSSSEPATTFLLKKGEGDL